MRIALLSITVLLLAPVAFSQPTDPAPGPEAPAEEEGDGLSLDPADTCPDCGSASVFEVDAVGEIVEQLTRTNATVDFVDPIETLTAVGHIAAQLRY